MLQATINGIVLGGAYALVSIGFIVLFNNTRFFNFAHGDFLTIGAYLGYTFTMLWHLPWYLGLLLVAVAMAVIGLGTELLTRPAVRRRALLVGAIATLGLGLVVRAVIQLVWGPQDKNMDVLVKRPAIHVFGAALDYQQLIILVVTVVVVLGLWLLYRYTFVGLVLRATADDPTAAQIMGVNTARVVKASFAGSAVLAGVAGALLAPSFFVSLLLGYVIVFKAMVGTMVGGFGSLVGAVVGSLVVGVLEVNAAYLIDPDYRNIAVYGLVILLFIVRPAGLFGTRLVEKV
ncbi:branched-chain amino acid ABC transporter permease [Phytohabitans sp. ZYX-F-186]|uniref:Branched-chain amino acid ABC transporter permease n=1 Tax=Phytohabitans maris TaxID=3071409 RepID=A0ABU0ZUU5_9ACTN|nr:branched-chain amino acid ABC transporter permease [Phytohabitans sp. ZYX-F-186]MDQ7910816.1 branched-chain amino acid ABC transporter permease [Phytohabitans sp. ZYX-F-186]